jgi:DNA-binding SARP family transcriptional activator
LFVIAAFQRSSICGARWASSSRLGPAGVGLGFEAIRSRDLLEFRILGPLEVVDERVGPVDLGGPRQRATLAILLLNANRAVSVDQIADDLYAGAAPVTALKQVQRQISELRKALGSESLIETRSPGYVIRLAPEQLDLTVFERLAAEASESEAAGDTERAGGLLRAALDLWRGEALADLSYEPFARAPIERLEEIRLLVLEQRIAADLAVGRHARLIPELEQLVVEHPLRERFRGQLMLALYGSGRQAEALEAYRQAREALVEECGIEPGLALRQLERQILEQDPSLELQPGASRAAGPSEEPERTVLAAPKDDPGIARLVTLAQPLARLPGAELIVARLVGNERELGAANESLQAVRKQGGATIRIAAFASADRPSDLVRLATAYDAALVLVDAPPEIAAAELPPDVVTLLEQSPADVAIASDTRVDWGEGHGIFVPFGGAEHDWAALELAAWLASAVRASLRLVGSRADPAHGQRDASRLLANASLAVQRLADVIAEPVLAEAAPDAFLKTLGNATLVVAGLSARWRTEGLGDLRRSLLRAGSSVVFVHAGPRPSGLAPRDALTRFSWSVAG